MNRSSFAKGVAAVAAGAMTLSTAGIAGAQAYPAPPPAPYGYAGCQQQAHSNGLLGAIVGGALGAVVGANVAANHHRSDGGLVGGGVGALVGAGVGSSNTACRQAPPQAYAAPPPVAYAEPPPPPVYAPPPVVAYEGPPPAYYAPPPAEVVVVYGDRGERFRVAHGIGRDGCGWAQAPVGPYGQPGWVRVCRGWHGHFHVVG
jgi:hypothetical protein